jgi:hypothetical protein
VFLPVSLRLFRQRFPDLFGIADPGEESFEELASFAEAVLGEAEELGWSARADQAYFTHRAIPARV